MRINREESKQSSAKLAGVAGAVVGAGVAILATKILSDQPTRKKIVKSIVNMKDKVVGSLKEVPERYEEASGKLNKRVIKGTKKILKRVIA